MAKTDLTKHIEARLNTYNPKELDGYKLNYMRDQYSMHEVPVTHGSITDGLIDFVWLAEGFTNAHKKYTCRATNYAKLGIDIFQQNCSLTKEDFLTLDSDYACTDSCVNCKYKTYTIEQTDTPAVICFEIKISKSDFHSRHGHNFVGNLNYYVMPLDLYKEVQNEIPEEIGCIIFSSTDKSDTLRKKKAAIWRNIDKDIYTSMLLTCMNKYRKDWTNRLFEQRLKADKYREIIYVLVKQKMLTLRDVEVKPDCFIEKAASEYMKNNPQSFNDILTSCDNLCKDLQKCKTCVFNSMSAYYEAEDICNSIN
jgi:hypothetical protein